METSSLIIAISVAVVALALVALIIFLITVLVSLKRTLDSTQEICQDVEGKLQAFDPLFRIAGRASVRLERKSKRFKHYVEEEEEEDDPALNTAFEAAEWALIGLSLWRKIRARRG